MVVNPPDPPDIHSVIEQLDLAVEQVPDWLWQGLAVWAAGKGIEWTFKHRKQIFDKLGQTPKPIVISLNPLNLTVEVQKIAVSKDLNLRWNTRSTVGNELQALWNVEASTPPVRLMDQGLELLSW